MYASVPLQFILVSTCEIWTAHDVNINTCKVLHYFVKSTAVVLSFLGYRYELYCVAKAHKTTHCIVSKEINQTCLITKWWNVCSQSVTSKTFLWDNPIISFTDDFLIKTCVLSLSEFKHWQSTVQKQVKRIVHESSYFLIVSCEHSFYHFLSAKWYAVEIYLEKSNAYYATNLNQFDFTLHKQRKIY